MSLFIRITTIIFCTATISVADDPVLTEHQESSSKVANRQDELSADVQQLTIEQSIPKVIELLNEVEAIMDEATDKLAAADTGGGTLAAQTEIIEKIHAAAKEKQNQQGSGQSGSAMMDMMERMLGKQPSSGQEANSKEKGDQAGDTGGKGVTGLSDEANEFDNGATTSKSEARRVPKAAGNTGRVLPEEFRKALDAYNRGAEKKIK
jgi:hypothetical protein